MLKWWVSFFGSILGILAKRSDFYMFKKLKTLDITSWKVNKCFGCKYCDFGLKTDMVGMNIPTETLEYPSGDIPGNSRGGFGKRAQIPRYQ
jgi:hypothetical protein